MLTAAPSSPSPYGYEYNPHYADRFQSPQQYIRPQKRVFDDEDIQNHKRRKMTPIPVVVGEPPKDVTTFETIPIVETSESRIVDLSTGAPLEAIPLEPAASPKRRRSEEEAVPNNFHVEFLEDEDQPSPEKKLRRYRENVVEVVEEDNEIPFISLPPETLIEMSPNSDEHVSKLISDDKLICRGPNYLPSRDEKALVPFIPKKFQLALPLRELYMDRLPSCGTGKELVLYRPGRITEILDENEPSEQNVQETMELDEVIAPVSGDNAEDEELMEVDDE